MYLVWRYSICLVFCLHTIMETTTGPLITHQRAVFSLVSQHLEGTTEMYICMIKTHDGTYEFFRQKFLPCFDVNKIKITGYNIFK